jgi:hypothetical protein
MRNRGETLGELRVFALDGHIGPMASVTLTGRSVNSKGSSERPV